MITDQIGTSSEIIKRDAWGEILSNSYDSNNVLPTSVGFAGQRQDYDADLTYNHARYLSNANRVWLSEDPLAIGGFGSDVFLMNPQIQNSYSYASNDPVNRIDPLGLTPKPKEAAIMARQIYDPGKEGSSLIGGWVYNGSITGKDEMMMGIYSRIKSDKSTEYSFVFRGTRGPNKSDWKNNFQQPFGLSDDATSAINLPGEFMNTFRGSEVTFVGHSKGGAEATLAAVKYGYNAITFNPARANTNTNGLIIANYKYSGSITNYIVSGELLSNTVGLIMPTKGKNIYLPSVDYNTPFVENNLGSTMGYSTSFAAGSLSPLVIYDNSFKDHLMDAVITSLDRAGY